MNNLKAWLFISYQSFHIYDKVIKKGNSLSREELTFFQLGFVCTH